MLRLVARRSLISLPLLFLVPLLTFVLTSLAPGDPARTILGEDFTQEAYDKLYVELGLDRSILEQYLAWIFDALRGDFGVSPITGLVVWDEISSRIWVTTSLVVVTTLAATLIGLALGVASAVRSGWLARTVDVLSLVGFSFPSYWIGLISVAVFAVALGWFPAAGYVALGTSPRDWTLAITLPTVALAVHAVAAIAKQTRDAMLDALAREHIHALRARGVSEVSVVLRHALRNASIPVATVVGLVFISLLDGTVLVENVFALPGLGSLVVDATKRHDLPVLQGIVLTFTVVVIVVNLLVDIAYGWLNPKVRVR